MLLRFPTTRSDAHTTSVQALLHALIGIGILGMVSKLHKWDESAMFFDGSSLGTFPPITPVLPFGLLTVQKSIPPIAAYVFGVAVYITVTIPALRTIVTPIKEETREVQLEALSVLSAGNLIIVACLLGVLLLQVREKTHTRICFHFF